MLDRFRVPLTGRHHHAEDVRSDGLAVVLGPLLHGNRINAVALTEVQSGMVLDACATGTEQLDLEMLGARHAELVRVGLDVLGGPGGAAPAELVLSQGDRRHHVLRTIADPYGDRLVLSAVVHGSRRELDRVLRRLRQVPVEALTAGPSLRRRPVAGRWALSGPMWTAPEQPGAAELRVSPSGGPPVGPPERSPPSPAPVGPAPDDLLGTRPTGAGPLVRPDPSVPDGAVARIHLTGTEGSPDRPPSPPSALPSPR